jgi:prepilin-type N-terminal cleavage/methylation domain-containing protein
MQRGDTIIEVLIAMAVISLVLGGAFATTRRSQTGVLDSQEHATALKLIESQLEQLRSNASSASPAVFSGTATFCMAGGSVVSSSAAMPAASCVQDSSGNPAAANAEPGYTLLVARSNSINSGYVFNVQATWDEVSGTGRGSESMTYRLYNN